MGVKSGRWTRWDRLSSMDPTKYKVINAGRRDVRPPILELAPDVQT
jgi:hypothetical protein